MPQKVLFTDDQTVPQGHHFGATYFFECKSIIHNRPLYVYCVYQKLLKQSTIILKQHDVVTDAKCPIKS